MLIAGFTASIARRYREPFAAPSRTIESDERLSPRTFGRLPAAAGSSASPSSAAAALAERVEDLPKPTDYVSDFAHVLSPEAIARLDSLCAQLDHSQANAQIAVVTIHTLDGDDAADFANAA